MTSTRRVVALFTALVVTAGLLAAPPGIAQEASPSPSPEPSASPSPSQGASDEPSPSPAPSEAASPQPEASSSSDSAGEVDSPSSSSGAEGDAGSDSSAPDSTTADATETESESPIALAQAITDSHPSEGGDLALTSIAGLDPDGGWLVVAPGETSQEIVLYDGVDTEALIATGIYRPDPAANPEGTSVASSGVELPEGCGVATTSSAGDIDTSCVDALIQRIGDLVVAVCAGDINRSASDGSWSASELSTTSGVVEHPCVDKAISVVESVMIIACQSADAATCATNLIDKIDDTLGTACGLIPVSGTSSTTGLPPGVATCVLKVLDTVNLVMNTACQSTTATTCVNNVIDKVNDLVVNACSGQINLLSSTYNDAVATCTNTVISAVNTVMLQVCQSTNAATCANNLVDKINDLLVNACNLQVSTSSSTEDAIGTCVNRVITTVNTVMLQVCQSTNATTCVNNLIDKIDDTLATACGAVPVAPGGDTTGVPPGVGECVTTVLGTVNLVMNTACQSTTATTCVNNLIDKIDDTLATACGAVPVAPGGDTTGVPPGVGECVVTVLGTINLVMTTACQSTTATTCATNLLDKINDLVANACSGSVTTSPSYGDATATCVNLVISTVNTVMTVACQSTNAATCANNLLDKINDLVANACSGSVTTSPSYGDATATCVNLVISTVNTVMTVACQSTDAEICAANLIQKINDLLVEVCTGSVTATSTSTATTTTDLSHPCVVKIMEAINLVMMTACQSTTAEVCIANLIAKVSALLTDMCGVDTSGVSASSPAEASGAPAPIADQILGEPQQRIPIPESASRPPDTPVQSMYSLSLLRIELLVDRLEALNALVPVVQDSIAQAQALLDQAEGSSLPTDTLLVSVGTSATRELVIEQLDSLLSSSEASLDAASAALLSVPDADYGLNASYQQAAAGIDPTEDPFYLLLSDTTSDAATRVLGVGSSGEFVAGSCLIGSLQLMKGDPNTGSYAQQLLDVVQLIQDEVIVPINGLGSFIVAQIENSPDAQTAADDAAPEPDEAPPPTSQEEPDCFYEMKEDLSGWIIYGSSGDDSCTGSDGDDTFYMRGGADHAWGLGGEDVMIMGDGRDYAEGNGGADDIQGREGVDTIHAGRGQDWIEAGKGADYVYGDYGDDWMRLGNNPAVSSWEDVYDVFYGGPGHDTALGEHGNHVGEGGDGQDWLFDDEPDPDHDRDILWGQWGRDWADIDDGDVRDYFYGGGGDDECPRFDDHPHPTEGSVSDYVDLGADEESSFTDCH